MAVSPDAVGMVLPPISMDIERGRLAAFARVTRATDPAYSDLDAAKNAGHRDIPVPPTFLFAIELEQADPFWWARNIGVEVNYVLHGEQRFTYHRVAYAGERLTANAVITDVFSKRGGALEFIIKKTAISDEAGARGRGSGHDVVVRNPGVGS
ncbi:MaoC family dehydratase N-terminal domain-containing protein [Sporichthya sp.]|uniref:FAS1-like dehydratase domain-containing protein n=1 Tax=Sporichthya sp. TaxID=65475 RepID=UPI0017DEE0B9|nr:MaoC family dehydratase N-terminal domain-containing protein [Sporichthya sp.]MBA3742169.1 MaoC family dehydratase N-terminal domain-containing protein [Sporichthya sp.]